MNLYKFYRMGLSIGQINNAYKALKTVPVHRKYTSNFYRILHHLRSLLSAQTSHPGFYPPWPVISDGFHFRCLPLSLFILLFFAVPHLLFSHLPFLYIVELTLKVVIPVAEYPPGAVWANAEIYTNP